MNLLLEHIVNDFIMKIHGKKFTIRMHWFYYKNALEMILL